MNAILEEINIVPYFTNMKIVFDALGISATSFDWYVSDVETNYYGLDFNSDDRWITGEDLDIFLSKNEIQFIWAVFSAVPKGFRVQVLNRPFIQENPDYWNGKEMTCQLPGALFEIACWDSSATLFIGLPEDMLVSFCSVFPDTKPLNTRREI